MLKCFFKMVRIQNKRKAREIYKETSGSSFQREENNRV